MTRYQYSTQQYITVVGYDPRLRTFFGQVWEKAKTPDSIPLLWSGAAGTPVTLPALRVQLEPYGSIPPGIVVQLLRDYDADDPMPFGQLCRSLVELCLQSPQARLTAELPSGGMYYAMINQNGWQLFPWSFSSHTDALATFARLIYGERAAEPGRRTEEIFCYISDRTIVLHVDAAGAKQRLPVYAGVTMAGQGNGALLSGPIIVTATQGGLMAKQVSVVQEELFFVVDALRKPITDLWYHGWETLVVRRKSL